MEIKPSAGTLENSTRDRHLILKAKVVYRLFDWYKVIQVLFFLAVVLSGQLSNSPEDRLLFFRLLKIALFGWSNKKLAQSESDLDFIRNLYYYDVSKALLLLAFCLFFLSFMWCRFIMEKAVMGEKAMFDGRGEGDTLRGVLLVDPECEYDPETNRHDVVATRLFAVFIFLPSLLGFSIYSFNYGPYEGIWYVPMMLHDFFWYFGNIIWIPQIYLHYILRTKHLNIEKYELCKTFSLLGQVACIAYCLYSGLLWLVVKHQPAAIAGQLIDTLVCLALYYQNSRYKWVNTRMNSNELEPVVADKGLPDLVVSCEPQPQL